MLGLDVEWNEKNNTVTITTPQDDEDEFLERQHRNG